MSKYVYMFSEGDATMRNLLGGKGANLAEMTKIGLPVPQGFTITTEACTKYYEDGKTISDDIIEADLRCNRKDRRNRRKEVWRSGEPVPGIGSFRRESFHARHDGYHPEPGS